MESTYLIEALRAKFDDPRESVLTRHELQARTQKKTESIPEFAAVLSQVVKKRWLYGCVEKQVGRRPLFKRPEASAERGATASNAASHHCGSY